MSIPTYSGIPYPAVTKTERYVPAVPSVGFVPEQRDRDIQPIPSYPRERALSFGEVQQDTSSPAKMMHQMDMEFQRVKLYDARKRPQSTNFQESNGGAYSNYIVGRVARILKHYRRVKYEEARQIQGLPQQQPIQRTSSSMSLARSGSFTNLAMTQSKTEEYGNIFSMSECGQ